MNPRLAIANSHQPVRATGKTLANILPLLNIPSLGIPQNIPITTRHQENIPRALSQQE
jgi:hypothetical protein